MPPIFPFLPLRLSGLVDVACNLSWSWNREARRLFSEIDQQLWTRLRHDPLELPQPVGAERPAQCAAAPVFMEQYDAIMRWSAAEQVPSRGWFAEHYPEQARDTIAYFCAEFG